ncbi:MAG: hypothetical protein HC906_20060 [Bacteroidales bacterium]|nr:hypothetical protein [Bacteroidales bacterium]
MSSAGHILDMIIRMRNNEALRKMVKSRYKDLKEAYNKHKAHHIEFIDRPRPSDEELMKIKLKIRNSIKRERRIYFIQLSVTTLILLTIFMLLFQYLFNHFYTRK